MSRYRFITGDVPAGYEPAYAMSLFNAPAHRRLQREEGWLSFHIVDDASRRVRASIHFNTEEGVARSHPRSPFGSFDVTDDVEPESLSLFFDFIHAGLKKVGVGRVIVKCPAMVYYAFTAFDALFADKGYRVVGADISSILRVDEEKPLHTLERSKLRRAHQQGLSFRRVPVEELPLIYNFVSSCREKKGYTLSMREEELSRAVKLFPDRYLLFSVMRDTEVIAAAITVRVRHDVLYDFAHDHHADYNTLSPVVFLMEGMRSFCISNRIRLIDMGTSNAGGTINFGLLKFKIRLGAHSFPKFTFEKIL